VKLQACRAAPKEKISEKTEGSGEAAEYFEFWRTEVAPLYIQNWKT